MSRFALHPSPQPLANLRIPVNSSTTQRERMSCRSPLISTPKRGELHTSLPAVPIERSISL